jgi:hypothetical protein
LNLNHRRVAAVRLTTYDDYGAGAREGEGWRGEKREEGIYEEFEEGEGAGQRR